ncbi:DUF6443 domain-containing protein [Chryseobacterium sp. RLHN22]|uniref:DUF6443 domain-containing protein n=1 Tax=Chryseobacterium sp. RLHN22 TaxID=3437885 RepID=UPI003D9B290D
MKKILLLLHILVTVLISAQNLSNAENYFYSRTYLEPVTASQPSAQQIQSVQYLDGLGRTKQSIAIQASPTGKDIIIPSEYDNSGMQTKNYLPLPVDTQNGAFVNNILGNSVNTFYGVPNAYSEIQTEKSPLARIEKIASPGIDWQINGTHTKKIKYLSNAGGVVKRFKAMTIWNSSQQINDVSLTFAPDDSCSVDGYYIANTLYKIVKFDEDGNESHNYINGYNQKILVRQINRTQSGDIENLDTYYVYDKFGNLSYIIPPKAAVLNTIAEINGSLNNIAYQYKYDKYNRVVEKKLPGKDWSYIVYDKQNRQVLVQDGKLRTTENNFAKKGWMFSKYDKFGRTLYTGFFANTSSRVAMQSALNNMSSNALNNETASSTPFTLNNIDVYYTKNAFPTGSMTLLAVYYYDEYPTGAVQQPSQIQNQPILGGNPTPFIFNGWSSIRSIKTLPAASYIKNIEDDQWTKAFIWYDTLGRVVGTHSNNHLGGSTTTEKLLNFSGLPEKNNIFHARRANEPGVIIKERYTYDSQMRLKKHYHQVDDMPEVLLSENNYNDLSQLINKKVGNNLQSIDYNYNIRGWVTDVNKDQMQLADLGGKLFAYKIKYNQKDGITNPDPTQFPGKNVAARYNGSVAEVDWRTVETLGVNPSLIPKRYGYVYDEANHLTAGYYQNPNNPYSKENTESINYDLNGNISTLFRTSVMEAGTNTATVIDNLNYTYTGNKVTNINDVSNNFAGYEGGGFGMPIQYDVNGNMLNMPDKGINAIEYNFLNLPTSMDINKNGNEQITIKTKYRADGTKLSKENSTIITGVKGSSTVINSTDYIDGFQYFSSNSLIPPVEWELEPASQRAMEEQAFNRDDFGVIGTVNAKTPELRFFATEEGFYDYQKDQYIYQYRDQLGNARVSYARNNSGNLEIIDNNDYYPFGMNHLKTGNSFYAQGSYKSYKYNAKEMQETGLYDYGWRQYMPDIGRWSGQDQFSEVYHNSSTYAYVLNNPINMSDPDGRYSQIQDLKDSMPNIYSGWEYVDGINFGDWHNFASGAQFSAFVAYMAANGGGGGGGGGGSYSGGSGSSFGSGSSGLIFNDGLKEMLLPELMLTAKSGWGTQMWNHYNNFMNDWNSGSVWDSFKQHFYIEAEGYVDAGPQVEASGKLFGIPVGLNIEGRHTEKFGFSLNFEEGQLKDHIFLGEQSENTFGFGIGAYGMESVYKNKMFGDVAEFKESIGPVTFKFNHTNGERSVEWTPIEGSFSAIIGITGGVTLGWKY